MGVRGFTTYMAHHSHLFLEAYKLQNCYLILDGSGIAISLYLWHSKSNDCFGGDYDSYANTVNIFFGLLKMCNVTPIILFDGGYENRKLKTVLGRMRNRIGAMKRLVNSPNGNISMFPLMVKDLFLDIALQFGIKCIRNDYESDSEIACLARNLNCPILGYDSDFFFFDTLYIPFDRFEMRALSILNKAKNKRETYIPCQVYSIDTFLNYFGGLDKSNFPLLPVLLGNDYVKKSLFSSFYKHIKLKKSRNENEQQRMIKTIINWLRHETLESAITKLLGRFKSQRRKFLLWHLNNAMMGYLQVNSSLIEYLDKSEKSVICTKKEYNIDISGIETVLDEMPSDEESLQDFVESSSDENEDDKEGILENLNVSENSCLSNCEGPIKVENASGENTCFLEKYRKCELPQCFVDIKFRNMYFCLSQVEDLSEPHSHTISMNIIHCIHKILTLPQLNKFICVVRGKGIMLRQQVQPICTETLPSFSEIQYLNENECKKWFFAILKIDQTLTEFLEVFPSSWHLFLIAFYYWKINSSNVDSSYIYALIMSTLLLNFVDPKVGFCRDSKTFYKKFKNCTESTVVELNENIPILSNSVINSFEHIDYNESFTYLKALLPYFKMDDKIAANNKLYDVTIVSKFSQFQSCFFHIKYLNSIFNFPFENTPISKYFCGTLLYNLTANFRKRTNLKAYIGILLKDCRSFLNSFELIVDSIDKHLGESCESDAKKIRRRKRRKQSVRKEVEIVEDVAEEEFYDEDNKYSLLQHIVS